MDDPELHTLVPKLQKIVSELLKDCNEEDEPDSDAYFSECELTSSDISVTVQGIGTIELPLTKNCIERLISVSSKALCTVRKYSIDDSGERVSRVESSLNEAIHKAHEITGEKVSITFVQSSLIRLLEKVRKDLKLPENISFSPVLKNILIYGRGQFFDVHLAPGKKDNIVAILTIVLPSAHIGGDLVIYEPGDDANHVFSTENVDELGVKCVAFDTECIHKLTEVRHGYRVALTIDLSINYSASQSVVNPKLKEAIQEYFSDDNSKKPQKLMYLLSEEYALDDLQCLSLKGSDVVNVSSIQNVAQSLDLVSHLGYVKVVQTYAINSLASPDDPDEMKYKSCTTEAILTHWIDANKVIYKKLNFNNDEICWTTSVESFEHDNKELSLDDRLMGNMLYYYKRFAVVLWPKTRQTTMKFIYNPEWAVRDLLQLARVPGNEKQVMETVQKAGDYLYVKEPDTKITYSDRIKVMNTAETNFWGVTSEHPDVLEKMDIQRKKEKGLPTKTDECFRNVTDIVLYVNDKQFATNVLSHYSLSIMKVSAAVALAKLQNKFGIDWFIDILAKWKNGQSTYDTKNVFKFIQVFMQNQGHRQVAALLLELQTVSKDESRSYDLLQLARLKPRLEKIEQLFKACELIENVSLLNNFIKHLLANPNTYPFLELVDFFLSLKDKLNSVFYANFETLKTHLIEAVDSELAPLQSQDLNTLDWSLDYRGKDFFCVCWHCKQLTEFLASKTEVIKKWPLVLKFRKHVLHTLKGFFTLPIDVSVEKHGTPHTLVLEKRCKVPGGDYARFTNLLRCQEALKKHEF